MSEIDGGGQADNSGGAGAATGDGAASSDSRTGGLTPGAQASWRDSLPDDLKGNPALSRLNDVPALAKSYVELERMRGVPADQLAQVPKDWENEAQRNAFYDRAGRPPTPEDYRFPDAVEGVPRSDETVGHLRKWAHEEGLNNRQAAGMLSRYEAHMADQIKAQHDREEAMIDEWLAEANKLPAEIRAAANQAATVIENKVGPEVMELLRETGLSHHPAIFKALGALGKYIPEDVQNEASSAMTVSGTSAGAEAEINRLMADPDFNKAYMTQNHPGHKEAVDKLQKLFVAKNMAA